MNDQKPSVNDLLARARDEAQMMADKKAAALLLEVCAAASTLVAEQESIRKEAFRDGIRGAAKVIRNRQAAPGSALSELFTGDGTNPDLFADELAKIAASTAVTVNDLRKLRQKVNAAPEGSDEIDDEIRRIYYSVMSDRNPTSADILPPGSPSRSLDVATFVIEKILREGWWTLGNGGVNTGDKPVGKVGLTPAQSSKPQTAATAPLTLLSALILTLIESSKAR
ncbi:hypothetical protein JNB71_16165 [Rhizobium herbae]|uniref:Uncharacterized protein n=2 Tax=Rhizobium herbae TaxID=508661 RepID=A0ABS7HC60_9HYPH|nr:hypothetical protein [Rhizobium herbae]